MLRAFFIFTIFIISIAAHAQSAAPSAVTKYGTVIGADVADADVFEGIPYAAPPLGALRFAAPQEPAPWSQPLAATTYGAQCPQTGLVDKSVTGDEDCLTLNIWRPKNAVGPLPVMIFIPGGANTVGSATDMFLGHNLYDGGDLSQNGVIVITLNYRLGPLGFLAHKSLETADGQVGNYGILDQIQALKFVQENIAAFGGDPHNVTLFGESAGAIDILVLMSSPLSAGLYNRVIIESGFLNDLPKAQVEATGDIIAKDVGCTDAANVAACLRAAPAASLIKAYAADSNALLAVAGATIDGVVLKQSVYNSIMSGQYQKVPVIMGDNAQEFRTLAPLVVPMGLIFSDADYAADLTMEFGATASAKIQAYYPSIKYGSARDALDAALTDYFTLCPAAAITRRFIQDTPQTFRYVFTHATENWLMHILGAGHGVEVPYVFGTISHWIYAPTEFNLSTEMQKYWSQFAKTSDPSLEGQPMWPAVNAGTYLDLDVNISVGNNYHEAACEFWDQLGVGQGVIK